jgi:dephospho-CoA kinase
MKKVILMSGKIHCGKNQFAEYLKHFLQKKGLKVTNDLFARSLKDGCKEDFRKLSSVLGSIANEIKSKIGLFVDQRHIMLNPNILNDIDRSIDKLFIKDDNWYEDKTDITRNVLQLYGTEIFRKRVDENWWVKQVKNRCIASDSDVVIVTDCRFPNEITEMLITRNINTQEQIASHASETSLDDWKEFDFVVENNGSLEDLKNASSVIASNLTEKYQEDYDGLFTIVSKENLQFLSKVI